jgi:hypothetical protein
VTNRHVKDGTTKTTTGPGCIGADPGLRLLSSFAMAGLDPASFDIRRSYPRMTVVGRVSI